MGSLGECTFMMPALRQLVIHPLSTEPNQSRSLNPFNGLPVSYHAFKNRIKMAVRLLIRNLMQTAWNEINSADLIIEIDIDKTAI